MGGEFVLFDLKNGVLTKYYAEESDSAYVQLPEGIIAIGAQAFSGCGSIRRITLPEGVTRIEERAFSNCYSLSDVCMPQSLETIGERAFADCWLLRRVDFPETMTRISRGAFHGCSALKEIYLPDGLTVLEAELFSMCENLYRVSLPASLEKIANFGKGSSGPFFAAPLRELELRGGWFDGFSRALNISSYIRMNKLYVQDVSNVPDPFLTLALSTFAQNEADFSPEVRAHYHDYLRTNPKKKYDIAVSEAILNLLCRENLILPHHAWEYFSVLAFRADRLTVLTDHLCRNALIDSKTFQSCLDTSLAHDLTEITAMLLEYRQTHASEESDDDLTL